MCSLQLHITILFVIPSAIPSHTQKRHLGRKNSGVNGLGIKYEKNKKIEGHHKEYVRDSPDKMTDPRNIEFMEKRDHIDLHKKETKRSTSESESSDWNEKDEKWEDEDKWY